MKKCTRCKKEKLVEKFNFKNKAKNIRQSHCKECTRFFIKNHYNKNREYYLTKSHKRNKLNVPTANESPFGFQLTEVITCSEGLLQYN